MTDDSQLSDAERKTLSDAAAIIKRHARNLKFPPRPDDSCADCHHERSDHVKGDCMGWECWPSDDPCRKFVESEGPAQVATFNRQADALLELANQ